MGAAAGPATRPDSRRPSTRPSQPANPGSHDMAGGPSLVRIDVRVGGSRSCLGADFAMGEEAPRTGETAVRPTPEMAGALEGRAGNGRPRALAGAAAHGAQRVAQPSRARAISDKGPAAASRAGDSGWYLTTRGLAVVMASFVVALVLGAAAVVHAFVTISGTDPQGSQRGAVVALAQHSEDPGTHPVANTASDGS